MAAYSESLGFFLASRLLQGFGACAIVVSAFASVRDKYNAIESGVMYSYLNSAICCIPALAPLLGNVLTENFGWRSNFEFMTGYAVFAGLILFFTLKETRPTNTEKQKKLISLSHFSSVIKHPVFLFNALLVMLSMAIIIAYVSSSPAWLMVRLGLDQQSFVFWFSVNAAINIVACFLAPKVFKKIWCQSYHRFRYVFTDFSRFTNVSFIALANRNGFYDTHNDQLAWLFFSHGRLCRPSASTFW